MALETDSTFGVCYMSTEAFKADAALYGADKAIANLSDDSIKRLMARASRAIDNYTGRTFAPGLITENHPWNPATRQVKINQPPVLDLVSYQIRIGAGFATTFPVTPVENDVGGNPIRFGVAVYNRQENFLEINSLAIASNLTSQILTLGLKNPWVEIVYRNIAADAAAVDPLVADACGWTAAHMINTSRVNAQIAPGITRVTMGEVTLQRDSKAADQAHDPLPAMAKTMLRGLARISIA